MAKRLRAWTCRTWLEAMVQNTASSIGFPRPTLTEAPNVLSRAAPTVAPEGSFSPPSQTGLDASGRMSSVTGPKDPAEADPAAVSPPVGQPDTRDAAYSAAYRACMASGDAAAGVTLGILNCVGDENARQDARLNQGYTAALARLSPTAGEALRTSEREWLHSRDANCKQAMENEGGTLGSVIYSQCVLKQEAARADYVEALR